MMALAPAIGLAIVMVVVAVLSNRLGSGISLHDVETSGLQAVTIAVFVNVADV